MSTRTRTAAERYGWADTVLDDDQADFLDRMAGAAWHRAEARVTARPVTAHPHDRWDGDDTEWQDYLAQHPAF